MQYLPAVRVASIFGLFLLACGGGGSKSDESGTASSTGGGDETFGMGETSASGSSPSDPTSPTTSGASITSASDVTGDPTVSTTTTADPSEPGTISISISDTDVETTNPTVGTATDTTTTTTDGTTTMPGECMDPPGQQQDATCTDASGCGCASGQCFLMPILGGWCGECQVDAHCSDGGCTIPNPVAGVGAACNKGEPGAGCQSDEVCADPNFAQCNTVLKVEGILTVSTCGECKTNVDCPQGLKNCSPVYDLPAFSGMFECVADASVPNNEGCNLQLAGDQPIGNKACQSGFCGTGNVMGLLTMGICGECNANSDCNPGEECTDAMVDLNTNELLGSVCI